VEADLSLDALGIPINSPLIIIIPELRGHRKRDAEIIPLHL
jgi:hypothetical protein